MPDKNQAMAEMLFELQVETFLVGLADALPDPKEYGLTPGRAVELKRRVETLRVRRTG